MTDTVTLRKARIEDVTFIHQIIMTNAKEGVMLPRPLQQIYENLRDFFVAETPEAGLVGCCALHISWADLAEIKSLAVAEDCRKYGAGRMPAWRRPANLGSNASLP